ncbi:hypothetical protein J6T66_01675 [bacterium]|nr:hypothetical protein [bacterium]
MNEIKTENGYCITMIEPRKKLIILLMELKIENTFHITKMGKSKKKANGKMIWKIENGFIITEIEIKKRNEIIMNESKTEFGNFTINMMKYSKMKRPFLVVK